MLAPHLGGDELRVDHDYPRLPVVGAGGLGDLADPGVEIESLDDLFGVFGQRELLPGEGTPLNAARAMAAAVTAAARGAGTASSMANSARGAPGENSLGTSSMSGTWTADGVDRIDLRELDDLLRKRFTSAW